MMKTFALKRNEKAILSKVNLADSFFPRLKGLMFKKKMPLDSALLLSPSNQIHTFFMKFPIDVIYLSKDNEIIKIEPSVMPGKVLKTVKGSRSVLELCSGIAQELSLEIGQVLTFEADDI